MYITFLTAPENLKTGETASRLSFHRFIESGYFGVHFPVTGFRASSAFFSPAARQIVFKSAAKAFLCLSGTCFRVFLTWWTIQRWYPVFGNAALFHQMSRQICSLPPWVHQSYPDKQNQSDLKQKYRYPLFWMEQTAGPDLFGSASVSVWSGPCRFRLRLWQDFRFPVTAMAVPICFLLHPEYVYTESRWDNAGQI